MSDKPTPRRTIPRPLVCLPESVSAPKQATAIDLAKQPCTDESRLNKTERAYLARLRMLKVPTLRIQQITLKVADDCRLTVDFTYVDENGRLTFVDVKGFQREDALIKMKVAARTFPEFRFVIAKRVKGNWEHIEVKP